MNLQTVELQIKRLLKAAHITNHPELGPKRNESIGKSTFGGLRTELFESLLLASPSESEIGKDDDPPLTVTFSHSYVMPAEMRGKISAELSSLIEARNQLIHNFQSQHDLDCNDCCEAALKHLSDLNSRAISMYGEIKTLREAQIEAYSRMAELVQSEFYWNMVQGIPAPPGQDWLMVGEIKLLVEASKLYAVNGRTNLQQAVEHVCRNGYDSDAYKNYGCKSWQDLADKSGLFSIEKQKNPKTERWEHFYRLGAKIPL